MPETLRFSVIIPILDEAATIDKLLSRLHELGVEGMQISGRGWGQPRR
ncbi:hypothetical protein FHR95_003154 [Halomonas fontilapidosi]|uniref:Uncharacterized protein n=1 Tax=Halomonas fontilapidosi TaxID=616675 RepID=A0A7W5DMD9_9GAMM|nr:hypothetical protein [Halomonas fontilapidosi]MBB3185564.1 hypothetical protein [Halomonas fontilapidosi]